MDALHKSGAIGEYSVMAKFTQGMRGDVQAHHILEKHLAVRFELGNTDKMPSVILSDVEHKAMTAKAAGTTNAKTTQELWQAYQNAYADRPHWLEAIKPHFTTGK